LAVTSSRKVTHFGPLSLLCKNGKVKSLVGQKILRLRRFKFTPNAGQSCSHRTVGHHLCTILIDKHYCGDLQNEQNPQPQKKKNETQGIFFAVHLQKPKYVAIGHQNVAQLANTSKLKHSDT